MISSQTMHEIESWEELTTLVESHSVACAHRDDLLTIMKATLVDFDKAKEDGITPQYRIVHSQAIEEVTHKVETGYLLYNRIENVNGTTIFIVIEDELVVDWRIVGVDAVLVDDIQLH